ncbi:uncharacterized protein LOC125258080 [Megalobrama amblycephala]|uniref:uncharacterized protein LOC125258080 n=1 Tax=Megalobrama amblycephala TaxID=75352 RepID=UPI0020143E8E|nr:uncharacterized protein LOC125258080 [Megalobrama amblycephala]XP_048030866.1 uncharacterized protein LOC125258080 [Megalobrama amblycephala]XP_048030867.1 uncharacterized protein LOC125258080 [Megalobrama amblycephala]XP_048030868.1 uncharacterized protein LOC125258080 [Megalobrama amblycephala]XP_048030869.1 uncharacterized protein LOC125258080 [Megalobrama amblycephala]
MADCTEVVVSESSWSPDFIQELLPSAERTALLHHLSFLCLGGFPKLEYLIRKQAIETQMLFRSSEAVLLKCVSTSSNMVTSLFPLVIEAVEKNKTFLVVKYLVKVKTWIDDIVRAVDDIVTRYEHQTQRVETCIVDVVQEQKETEENVKKHTVEMKALEDALAKLELELSKTASENNSPLNQEWDIKIRLIDLQMKLANCKIQQGAIPSPDHLEEVQKSLDQIRQILLDLKKFWEKVGVTLDTLKEKSFVGQDLIDIPEDMKEEFLNSIEIAGKYWKRFDECCQRAQGIFSVQSKDAYKFLEINPSSFLKDEWNKQYESIMEKLRNISPQGLTTATITE